MPTWPADNIGTTGLDGGTPQQARAELLSVAQAVKDMLAYQPTLKGANNSIGIGITPDSRWGAGVDVVQIDNVTPDPGFPGFFVGHDAAIFSMVEGGKRITGLAVDAIYDGTQWIGVSFDGEPMMMQVDDAGGITYRRATTPNLADGTPITFDLSADVSGPRTLLLASASKGSLGHVNFSSVIRDTGGFIQAGPGGVPPYSAILIPDGVTQIRVSVLIDVFTQYQFGIGMEFYLTYDTVRLNKGVFGGEVFLDGAQSGQAGTATSNAIFKATSAVFDVVPGRLLALRYSQSAGPVGASAGINSGGGWLSIEAIA